MNGPIDLDGPPACPGCAPLVAEIERLRSERQAILDAGGDFIWAGGAKTIPEAVAGALRALDVALTRSAKEHDASPAAKVRHAHPHVKLTDADLVRLAVQSAGRRGEIVLRYAAVTEVFQCNGDVAVVLCGECGLDPHDHVGDDGEGEE
jgi:hypothetical protein